MHTALDLQGLGQRLRQARQARGWTQATLAQVLEVGQGWISELERGSQRHIQAGTVVRLCQALDISADYLLGLRAAPCCPSSAHPAQDEEPAA